MSTLKEREAQALRVREEAKKFIEENDCKFDPKKQTSRASRDNTVQLLKQRQPESKKPTNKPVNEAPVVSSVARVSVPEGWRVAGMDFVHKTTGCVVRSAPPKVSGGLGAPPGMEVPPGWKIIKSTLPETENMPRFFYWNPRSGQTRWSLPTGEEHVTEHVIDTKREDAPVVTLHQITVPPPIANKDDATVDPPQALVFMPALGKPAKSIPNSSLSSKRAKPASMFDD